MKPETALSAEDHDQVHHAAALEDAADVAGAKIFWQFAAPNTQLGGHRNKTHAVGTK